MTKAKVLGRKRVPHLMRPGVKGMAFNARLHPDRADLLPKMLLGIADDLLRHVVRQQVVRFILDGDTCHRDAPHKVVSDDRRYGGVSAVLIPFTLRVTLREECRGVCVRGENGSSGGRGLL